LGQAVKRIVVQFDRTADAAGSVRPVPDLAVKVSHGVLGATTKADMGKVMKAVQAKTAGRADNRLVSQIVSAQLK
jgi:uncharacterized protein YqeY